MYKLTFKNNKDAYGSKKPYFTIKLKGKVEKDIQRAFKDTMLEFKINPCNLGKLKISDYKMTEKDGGVKISGLYYINETGMKIKLKQENSKGKGDFSVSGKAANNYVMNGINNYCGSIKVSGRLLPDS